MVYLRTKLTPNRKSSGVLFFLYTLGLIGLILLQQCRMAPLSLDSLPSSIKTLEGYASLMIKNKGKVSRGKVSFFLIWPDEARLDIADTLGRTVSQLLFLKTQAYLVLPRDRVYWQGPEEELFERLLGFSLSLSEWSRLLISQESLPGAWRLERDASGRIWRGQRNEVKFVIKRYVGRTRLVETLVIFYPEGEVRWRLREIYFNRPPREGLFSLQFTRRFQPKSWREIEAYLK